jgi:uncharacterized protein
VSDATLTDAGPLVALLDRSDRHHVACVEASKTIRGPLVTVWPALTEAMYLLAPSLRMQAGLLEWVELGSVKVAPVEPSDLARIRELMTKYKDRGMDFADAALVRVAERDKVRRIFTVDRKDFSIYRPLRLGRFSILP